MIKISREARGALFFLLCLILGMPAVSCGPSGSRREIVQRRALSESDQLIKPDATSAERFGFRPAGQSSPGGSRPQNPFRWDTPGQWSESPPTSMRVANLTFGESGEGECYLTAMPGDGGGVEANLNRWRTQMGQPPLSETEIEKLPRKTLLMQPVPFIEIDGDFTPMGASEALKDYRMLGVILSFDRFTLFVKMVGPRDVVESEEENFDTFCRSVRIVGTDDGANP